jgi:hypothetical protein
VSSCHPANAGVQEALVEELCRGGAKPDGLEDDGLPLWTALTFGYTGAAEALVRCGAEVDNVVFAAALGDLDDVNHARSAQRVGHDGRAIADHMLEHALIFAAGGGHRQTVEFLLTRGPDLGFAEPTFSATALGAARYHGRQDIVDLLETVVPPG